MKTKTFSFLLVVGFMASFVIQPAFAGTKEQLIQLQTTVDILKDNMAKMQQSFDERMGVMRDMVTQQTDSVNKMGNTIDSLSKALQQQNNDSAGKVDQLSGQVQSLHDAVDELKARLAKVGKQLDDLQGTVQNIQAPPAAQPGATPATAQPAQNQAPPADVLYNDALRDFNAGKNDLALQEFKQYLQYYGNTDLAGNAQFYVGEIEYRAGDYQSAIKDYNNVLDQFPGGNKNAAAQLKKGFAFLELGQRDAGVKELQSLINRYPKSPEAIQARDRLNRLGAAGASSKPARPSPRHP
ncbi:MAG TPA: tetratricopeptide repeat protein [Candidatus Angelobacter sp.]|jgi:tol-pal system protein YbgF|nr:tetratricopeptide repeat protein [Candidatus Angelobacter sp.]